MIKIFESPQIKELDNYTIINEPVSASELVERAASVFVEEYSRRFQTRSTRIIVFAGRGNNGADALAIARLLSERGYNVEKAILIHPNQELSAECEANKERLVAECKPEMLDDVYRSGDFRFPRLQSSDIIIDGLFGSGLKRPIEGAFAALTGKINKSGATIISIDLPSGLFGEDNNGNNEAAIIQADLTLSFEFPKLSFFFAENYAYTGEWKVLPIGIHPDAIRATDTPYQLITEEDIARIIQPRERIAHKGDFGHALIVAGGRGKTGAAVLAARSCLRSGAGLLTVHLPACGEVVMHISLPEAMVSIDSEQDSITCLPDLTPFDAIGVGCGMGVSEAGKAVIEALIDSGKPIVLDADALNIIATDTGLMYKLPENAILTPHPKEFDRFAGSSANSYERLQKAIAIAVERRIIIVLKGAYTAICTPEGDVYFNTTGNPGMATAGSGDTLTGVITGLLAQGYSAIDAAMAGVFIHGSAGDIAAATLSEESMLASDITSAIGKIFIQLKD